MTLRTPLGIMISFNTLLPKMTGLITKKKYTVTLELEIWDDTHPEDYDWKSILDLQGSEDVKVRVEEDEIW